MELHCWMWRRMNCDSVRCCTIVSLSMLLWTHLGQKVCVLTRNRYRMPTLIPSNFLLTNKRYGERVSDLSTSSNTFSLLLKVGAATSVRDTFDEPCDTPTTSHFLSPPEGYASFYFLAIIFWSNRFTHVSLFCLAIKAPPEWSSRSWCCWHCWWAPSKTTTTKVFVRASLPKRNAAAETRAPPRRPIRPTSQFFWPLPRNIVATTARRRCDRTFLRPTCRWHSSCKPSYRPYTCCLWVASSPLSSCITRDTVQTRPCPRPPKTATKAATRRRIASNQHAWWTPNRRVACKAIWSAKAWFTAAPPLPLPR